LEKKCLTLNIDEANVRQKEAELRREIDMLKDEKLMIQMDKNSMGNRESRVERENMDLKKELKVTKQEVYGLKDKIDSIYDDNSRTQEIKQKPYENNEFQDKQNLEDRLQLLIKEKKSLEEIFEKIVELIPSPELKKLIHDIQQVQADIDIADRERYNVEKKTERYGN
jgi:hypothetical protein